jgi:hypothetical protein
MAVGGWCVAVGFGAGVGRAVGAEVATAGGSAGVFG